MFIFRIVMQLGVGSNTGGINHSGKRELLPFIVCNSVLLLPGELRQSQPPVLLNLPYVRR